MDDRTDLAATLQAELRPLPSQIRYHLDAGDRAHALTLARLFEDEWLGLETRLLALGVGYIRFVAERLPHDQLGAATAWVAPAMTDALLVLPDLPEEVRPRRLHRVLSRVAGHEVDGPLTEPSEPSCEPDTSRLIEALSAGDDEGARDAIGRIENRWPRCQDRMVHLCASYAAWLATHHGEGVMDAAHLTISRWAEAAMDAIVTTGSTTPDDRVHQVLALLRAHTMDGRVEVERDRMRVDVECSSGLRMWRRGVSRFGLAEGPGPWLLGREQLPYYCCRCTTNLMRFHEVRGDEPPWRIDPPHDATDVCRWTVPLD